MLQDHLLRGQHIRLTAVSGDDLPLLARWWSDADFLRLYDAAPAFPRSETELAQRIQSGQKGETTFLFGIRPLDGARLIGLFEIDGVIWSHGTAHVSIAIGDPVDRNQGIATEAMTIGLRFAFDELNLHRVWLTVFSYNQPALALYQKLGFTREGVHREHISRDSRRYDMIIYGMLRREWVEHQSGTQQV